MPVRKYNLFPSAVSVDAIQFTADEVNLDEIRNFIDQGDELIFEDDYVCIVGADNSEVQLDIGDWLVKDNIDQLTSIPDVSFNLQYTADDVTSTGTPHNYDLDEEPDPMESDDSYGDEEDEPLDFS